MPLLRPLARSFPRPAPSSASLSSPFLLCLTAQQTSSLPPQSATLRSGDSTPVPTSSSNRTHLQIKAFSTTAARRSSDAHEDHYEPPSGWLFGVPPGEKYKTEGWEAIWVYGFWGSLALAVVAYAFKPDTSYVCFLPPRSGRGTHHLDGIPVSCFVLAGG